MYNICKERIEPLDVDGLIDDEDEITTEPCPCTQEGKTLEVHVPYASVEFHWKYKQIEYWGDSVIRVFDSHLGSHPCVVE